MDLVEVLTRISIDEARLRWQPRDSRRHHETECSNHNCDYENDDGKQWALTLFAIEHFIPNIEDIELEKEKIGRRNHPLCHTFEYMFQSRLFCARHGQRESSDTCIALNVR